MPRQQTVAQKKHPADLVAMAAASLASAPVLSTPDSHVFEDPTPAAAIAALPPLADEQLALTYEVQRTVREIRAGRWRRIALQFPDHMLAHGPRVYDLLRRGLARAPALPADTSNTGEPAAADAVEKLFILGDTSYGACCVDEVAAEHVDADVVVHYGRSCLSPPSLLPVIYVFTAQPLALHAVLDTFIHTYPDRQAKVVLMADLPYTHHMPTLHASLRDQGYTHLYTADVLHNPSSPLPNRSIPPEASCSAHGLRDYALFHVADPPTALLLTLSSRVASIHIYSTTPTTLDSPSGPPAASQANTAQTLRRRYALLTSLATTPVFGILINTLSVQNYMHILSHVQRQIAAAGKKSYTFVVGKVNAAKVANFSEVGGWVVIGCWESSLIESRDFWRPMITPWELEIALQKDTERVWTGGWEANFQKVLDDGADSATTQNTSNGRQSRSVHEEPPPAPDAEGNGDYDSDEESAPPEFDLRTGRYVSHSQPMRLQSNAKNRGQSTEDIGSAPTSSALAKRANGSVASIGGIVSPGAEFLRSQRTWQGLGSDHGTGLDEHDRSNTNMHAAKMEQGRSGIAKGYVVGDEIGSRH